MLAADGLSPISDAAPATLPVRATASKTEICRNVILIVAPAPPSRALSLNDVAERRQHDTRAIASKVN
jgi:hypothetical protein